MSEKGMSLCHKCQSIDSRYILKNSFVNAFVFVYGLLLNRHKVVKFMVIHSVYAFLALFSNMYIVYVFHKHLVEMQVFEDN